MNSQLTTIFFGATAVFTVLVFFIILFVVYYKQRQRQHLIEKRALQSAFEQEKMISGMEIQEQTFNEVSREIHDNIGQVLSLARMQLNNPNQTHTEVIQHTDELLERAIADIRTLSHVLNTYKVQSIGIIESTLKLVEQLKNTRQFNIVVDFDNVYPEPKDSHIIIYRMIQEIVNNIIKHSKANEIQLNIQTRDGVTRLTITDNGIGFKHAEKHQGIGMRNLTERAKLANASIRFNSNNGNGTSIQIQF
ncbi:MAG TPA: ATP-binding protein [Ferruginibacter sp.]|nr:ATP-binding protein [Ferruginibacter sp.]HRO18112.1 ATP-binding protein [Ferruginibacter sp.]HRQ21332.1 ATP-binding protein [Ferruginibacter sp.]